MRVNIISIDNKHSLTDDCNMVCETLKKLYSRKRKIQFEFAAFHKNVAKVADVNIYLGIINNSFFKYAPINILVIDQHKFDKVWLPYLDRVDYILAKNEYTKTILENYVDKSKIVHIGWKTQDKHIFSQEKTFDDYLFVLGQSNFRHIKPVLESWKPEYPKLNVLSGKNFFNNKIVEKKEQENINYIEEYQVTKEYLKLINSKGVHICLTSCSSFGNTLHDCITSKGVPIVLDCPPFREYVTNQDTGFMVKQKKKKKLKNSLGSEFTIDVEDFTNVIEKVNKLMETDEIRLEEMGDKGKHQNLQNDRNFDRNFKEFFDGIWDRFRKNTPIKNNYDCFDEELPTVSVITPTFNRKYLFDLAIRNFTNTDYPTSKIEWIIVDDSETENLQEVLPDLSNINYIKLDERKTIGEKRNIAVENSKNEIIVCMDDDDYYPPMSVKQRVASLLHLNKDLVGCTGLGILEVNKIISAVSNSSYVDDYSKRFYESTLAFKRSFWLENKFSETNIYESENMIKNNLNRIEEILWGNVIVSLSHYKNTNRRLPIKGETNGSHFKLPEEVFNLVTNFDNKDEDEPPKPEYKTVINI
jgi:hypothetical protein